MDREHIIRSINELNFKKNDFQNYDANNYSKSLIRIDRMECLLSKIIPLPEQLDKKVLLYVELHIENKVIMYYIDYVLVKVEAFDNVEQVVQKIDSFNDVRKILPSKKELNYMMNVYVSKAKRGLNHHSVNLLVKEQTDGSLRISLPNSAIPFELESKEQLDYLTSQYISVPIQDFIDVIRLFGNASDRIPISLLHKITDEKNQIKITKVFLPVAKAYGEVFINKNTYSISINIQNNSILLSDGFPTFEIMCRSLLSQLDNIEELEKSVFISPGVYQKLLVLNEDIINRSFIVNRASNIADNQHILKIYDPRFSYIYQDIDENIYYTSAYYNDELRFENFDSLDAAKIHLLFNVINSFDTDLSSEIGLNNESEDEQLDDYFTVKQQLIKLFQKNHKDCVMALLELETNYNDIDALERVYELYISKSNNLIDAKWLEECK